MRDLRRFVAVAAVAALTIPVLLASGCEPAPVARPTVAAPASSQPQPSPLPTTGPVVTPPTTIVPSATPPPSGTPSNRLRPGDHGPAVLALQQRLVALGYWLGPPDGRYGSLTTHAVTAFQKAAGLGRDGVAGPATRAALAQATRPRARSGSGSLIEIDLRRQLLLVVSAGQVRWVMDTSTGAVAGTTPRGRYSVYRQVDGYRHAPLGVLYRPKYFHEGVAVHGYPNVPPYPASHGCVRVTNATMDWLWSSASMPFGTTVWVY